MKIYLSIILVSLAIVLKGQHVKCYTDEMQEQLIDQQPELAEFFQNYHEASPIFKTTSTDTVYKIPVVFHIIYDDEADNISREQVLDALRVLNEDYSRTNADRANTRPMFQGVASSIGAEFVLAKLDVHGNCSEGITRVKSTLTYNANDNVKDLVNKKVNNLREWDNAKYLNIYVVHSIDSRNAPGTILGYAYKPRANQYYKTDGIMIRNDRVGTVGTANNVSLGRTLTHEAGHYLGLDHPFHNGCNGGDGCDDTPPVASPSYGCNFNANTCTNDSPDLLDQIENFMDYADDQCMNMFTEDQDGIVRGFLHDRGNSAYRNSLVTTSNHKATGVVPGQVLPCVPKADYGYDHSLFCQGDTVQFQNKTYMGNATSYSWSFPGGTPSTSTDENPKVYYGQSGNFNVQLTASNAQGSDLLYEPGKISVRPTSGIPWVNKFEEGFEGVTIPNNNWHVETPLISNEEFKVTNVASKTGLNSVVLEAVNISADETHSIVTNMISLENTVSSYLSFQVAFANLGDFIFGGSKLAIYSSIDCGETWVLVRRLSEPSLVTADGMIVPFIPNDQQWAEILVSMNHLATEPRVMLKFEFLAQDANNFYMDDIMLNNVLSDEEFGVISNGLNVYPNPGDGMISVDLSLSSNDANISVYDLNGRQLEKVDLSSHAKGEQTITLDLAHLKKGMYIIQFSDGEKEVLEKLIIQ